MIKIEEHMGLAYKMASKFYKRNKDKTIDEINSSALFGLVQAVNRFDENKGVKFSTFAVPTIVGAIKNDFYRDKSRFIRKTISGKQVTERIAIDSLNKAIPAEKDVEFIEFHKNDFDMNKEIENIDLKIAIDKLDKIQRKVITMIYFEGKTQNEVANLLGTSQVTVSRINKKALNLLKGSLIS
ncbi:sigma-70 family RNA polymerase sigma factor [Clostridium perfringens]|uniref:sigma-70 family RNA polymerase sigma factor n=1 Tax=Clostridium perfringens TaxID=1502 RepID=UPI0007766C2B|nr:sigma-70 family RNA polymerase sigma factor [Clostridium perfringens]AMN31738.1 hypothetical protein JFP55_01950 [Clostridium perfringens]